MTGKVVALVKLLLKRVLQYNNLTGKQNLVSWTSIRLREVDFQGSRIAVFFGATNKWQAKRVGE